MEYEFHQTMNGELWEPFVLGLYVSFFFCITVFLIASSDPSDDESRGLELICIAMMFGGLVYSPDAAWDLPFFTWIFGCMGMSSLMCFAGALFLPSPGKRLILVGIGLVILMAYMGIFHVTFAVE